MEELICCSNCKKYGVSCTGEDEIAIECDIDFDPKN